MKITKESKEKKQKRSKDYLLKVARWMIINLSTKQVDGTIAVQDVVNLIKTGAFYFVLLIFVFPVALPLPYPPGFPSICGIPIFLLSLQMIINKKVVLLPKFIRDYRIKIDLVKLILLKSEKVFRILSKIIKVDRLSSFVSSSKLTPIYGIVFTILSACILIPFPGTNFIPAVSIFLMCLGLLFKDGMFALIGLALGVVGIIIVYIFSAIFTSLLSRFVKFTYTKISSIYFSENSVMFVSGILIGMIGAVGVYALIKILIYLRNSRKN